MGALPISMNSLIADMGTSESVSRSQGILPRTHRRAGASRDLAGWGASSLPVGKADEHYS